MCARLGIPRASYYRWLDREESPTAAQHRELAGLVKAMFDSSDGIFGHRKIHTKIAAAGVEISVGTVAVIMADSTAGTSSQIPMALVGAEGGCSLTVSSVAENVTDPHVRFLRVLDETLPVYPRMAWHGDSDNPALRRSSGWPNGSGPAVPVTRTPARIRLVRTKLERFRPPAYAPDGLISRCSVSNALWFSVCSRSASSPHSPSG